MKLDKDTKYYIDKKIQKASCTAFSILDLVYDEGVLTLNYSKNCSEGSLEVDITPGINHHIEIPYNVQNYTELLTVTGQVTGEFAYVRESQGTSWLPGSMGGTYYPAGLYMWDGVKWIEDDTDIFSALENIVNAINTKQNILVSGTNIKTINGNSILGSGNLVISGGGGGVTSVDMTVPTGLVVSGNPITSTGTFALTYTAGYSIPLTADTAKGVTAFGYGDHALAGYLTSISSGQVISALGYTPYNSTNPSGYITSSALSGYLLSSTAAATYSVLGHTHDFADLTARPTTIAGYGIADAYTKTHIDNFFSGALAISGYNKSNWDTAFGWGNHASAGYLTNITGLITPGTNVTISGSGTSGSPYVINASGGGGGGGTAATVAEINTGIDNTVFASPLNLQTSKYLDQYGEKTQGVTAGTSTAYTLALNPPITSYTTGLTFAFKAHVASGANATININGIGAKQLVKDVNTNLVANDLTINQWYTGYYDGTNVLVKELGFAGKNTSATFLAAISNPQGSGQVVFDTNPQFSTAIRGAATFAAFNTTTTTLNFAGAVTTFNCGGTPTTALTANYFTNATATGVTKTLNFGTGGAAGSTTNINFGSASGTNNYAFNPGDIKLYSLHNVGRGGGGDIESTAFGYNALAASVTVGAANTAFGFDALRRRTSGYMNVAIGSYALTQCLGGYQNVALGHEVLRNLTSGFANLGVGTSILTQITTESYNTAMGAFSCYVLAASESTAFGAFSLRYTNSGTGNSAFGFQSLITNTTGTYNVAVGYSAGYSNDTGSYNTFVGYYTGIGMSTGSNNTIIGSRITGLAAGLSGHVLISDGAGSIRIKVDNNGHLSLPSMQVGNTGLSSGQTYKDTAANILANGDYVVGMKL